MIEDRFLTRTVKFWCEESKTWRTETERMAVQIRWMAGESDRKGTRWQLEPLRSADETVMDGCYSCNGSPRGCERGRFGQCTYCDSQYEHGVKYNGKLIEMGLTRCVAESRKASLHNCEERGAVIEVVRLPEGWRENASIYSNV